MGVIDVIAKVKSASLRGQGKVISLKKDYYQKTNIAEADLARERQELREAQEIKATLRGEELKPANRKQPGKLRRLGKGMAKHMNKRNSVVPRVGVPKSVNNKVGAVQGSPFGGQRDIDVGGNMESPFVHKRKRDLF